jgi:hypothetical protein
MPKASTTKLKRKFGRKPDWLQSPAGRYKVDYAVASHALQSSLQSGLVLPQSSVVSQCTAIGFTAKALEKWLESSREWKVEALGIPPYPGRTYPRAAGIASPSFEELNGANQNLSKSSTVSQIA